MGTFARIIEGKNAHIPEEKKQEFARRVIQLFQAGGMMNFQEIKLFDMKVYTLKKLEADSGGSVYFNYNYFEEDWWEDAGFHAKTCYIWSNKIGGREFNCVVRAAYTLQTLYTEGAAAVLENGDPENSSVLTGWINYIFHENYCWKNEEPWSMYEMLHDRDEKEEEEDEEDVAVCLQGDSTRWHRKTLNGARGYMEIRTVEKGINYILNLFHEVMGDNEQAGEPENKILEESEAKYKNFFSLIEILVQNIAFYKNHCTLSMEEQYDKLHTLMRGYYEGCDGDDFKKYLDDEELAGTVSLIMLLDAPVVVVKAVAEAYDKDFWKLWGELRNLICNTQRAVPESMRFKSRPVAPVSTADMFHENPDDLVYFWTLNGDIQFSNGMKSWFSVLKSKFDKLMRQGIIVEQPLKWILELMEYAQAWYYRIYTFNDFFEETVEHLQDQRYLALWKLYEELLHDPEIEKSAEEIFQPLTPEGTKDEQYFKENPPRCRQVKREQKWTFRGREIHDNLGRSVLRRYMGLVANLPLRKVVFGF